MSGVLVRDVLALLDVSFSVALSGGESVRARARARLCPGRRALTSEVFKKAGVTFTVFMRAVISTVY